MMIVSFHKWKQKLQKRDGHLTLASIFVAKYTLLSALGQAAQHEDDIRKRRFPPYYIINYHREERTDGRKTKKMRFFTRAIDVGLYDLLES